MIFQYHCVFFFASHAPSRPTKTIEGRVVRPGKPISAIGFSQHQRSGLM
ncbi:MAG: hypothetical protein ABFR90_09085 [Planctomycetota bacterium]